MTQTVQDFFVLNKTGLHARPAAEFVKFVLTYTANKVWIENISKQSSRVNAKSLTMLLSLSIQTNDEVRITIEGPNSDDVMQNLAGFFKRFGEEN